MGVGAEAGGQWWDEFWEVEEGTGIWVHKRALWSVQHISSVHKNKLIMTHHWKTQYCRRPKADPKHEQAHLHRQRYLNSKLQIGFWRVVASGMSCGLQVDNEMTSWTLYFLYWIEQDRDEVMDARNTLATKHGCKSVLSRGRRCRCSRMWFDW